MTRGMAGIADAIGKTPLISLPRLSDLVGREILGKAEFMNPGGSIKDRAALGMIEAAAKSGELKPGGTIVEGTAGNTGIGIAMLARALGYQALIVMPDNQSPEKYDYLRALGAELVAVPAVPFANQAHFYHTAGRMAQERGGFWANQFENLANAESHYRTTGPEVWEQSCGRIDALVLASGTGGTIAGTARYLREKKANVKIVLADPLGSGLYEYVKRGEMKSEGSSITEGIGIMRVTANFAQATPDDAIRVTDDKVVATAHWLVQHEGVFIGSSSALNVWAAARASLDLPRGARVVTILCDGGARYQSRLFTQKWLEEKKLWPVVSDGAALFTSPS